jgi:hypothetical protein
MLTSPTHYRGGPASATVRETRIHPLVEFLLARVAEDRDALQMFDACFPLEDRWVGECDAKRRIVELIAQGLDDVDDLAGCDVLIALALPHAAHPDCRPDWQL